MARDYIRFIPQHRQPAEIGLFQHSYTVIFDTAAFFKSPQSCCLFLLFTKFAQLKLRIRAGLQMFWLSDLKAGHAARPALTSKCSSRTRSKKPRLTARPSDAYCAPFCRALPGPSQPKPPNNAIPPGYEAAFPQFLA